LKERAGFNYKLQSSDARVSNLNLANKYLHYRYSSSSTFCVIFYLQQWSKTKE